MDEAVSGSVESLEYLADLLEAVTNEDWNFFLELLEPEELRASLPEIERHQLGVVMHALCCNASAPLQVFQSLLQVDGVEKLFSYQDSTTGRSCIHTAAEFLLDRPDAFELIMRTAANLDAVHILLPDKTGLRPIDVLCQEIYLLERFVQSLWPLPLVQHLDEPWECARILLSAHIIADSKFSGKEKSAASQNLFPPTRIGRKFPILHACFSLDKAHQPFLQMAIRRLSRQLWLLS